MDDKKEKLQSAAHFLFLKNGYKKTNIAQIAKKAGVAVGSFYNYYPSKQAIFLEVYIAENEAVRNRLIQEINWEGDIEQLIEQFFAYTVKNIMNNNILIEWNNDSVSKMLHDYYDYYYSILLRCILFDDRLERCPRYRKVRKGE